MPGKSEGLKSLYMLKVCSSKTTKDFTIMETLETINMISLLHSHSLSLNKRGENPITREVMFYSRQ